MGSNYARVEVEILSWLKTNPNDKKSVAEFLEMFKYFYKGTAEQLQNVLNMLELEYLIHPASTNEGNKSYEITREGLVALRSAPIHFN
jgi:DNA-binding PadR family transcriptional regulator